MRRKLNGQSPETPEASGLGDWNVGILVVLAFVMPPFAVLSSAYVTAWALRDHDRVRVRRYAPLLLVSMITTAGCIAWVHGERGWAAVSVIAAAALLLGLSGRSAVGGATRWLRARIRSQD
ncbi:MAG: hypothetical protein ACLP0J_11700 [Solirubrobacteraceae bacterium]